MRLTTTFALTILSLTFVGCNQLTRGGAAAMSFDDNPFLQSDEQQYVANGNASSHDTAVRPTAGVQEFDPNHGEASRYEYNPRQSQTTTQGPNVAWQFDLPADNAPSRPVTAPSGARPTSGPSSPAARAEAQVAEYLAQKHAPTGSELQRVAHEVPGAEPAGTARFDFSTGGPEQFDPNPFASPTSSGVVHAGHQVESSSDGMPILSEDDLSVESARPAAAASPANVLPGTNIPIPTGRALMFNDEMLGMPAPAGSATNHATQQQPTFTPPTTQVRPGQVPRPVAGSAIPLLRGDQAGTNPAPSSQPAGARQLAPVEPARPVIRDSRSDSKWRATRRM